MAEPREEPVSKGQYGEPWEIIQKPKGSVGADYLFDIWPAQDGEGYLIGWGSGLTYRRHKLSPEQGRRIVACVNACDGIDPEKLGAFLKACRALRNSDFHMQDNDEWSLVYDKFTGEYEWQGDEPDCPSSLAVPGSKEEK